MEEASIDQDKIWLGLTLIILTGIIIVAVHHNMNTADKRKAVFQKIAEILNINDLNNALLNSYYPKIKGMISNRQLELGLLAKGGKNKTVYTFFSLQVDSPNFIFKLIHKDSYSSIVSFFNTDYYIEFEEGFLPPDFLIKTNDPSFLKKLVEKKIFENPIIPQLIHHKSALELKDNQLSLELKKIVETESDIPFVMEMIEALGNIALQIEATKH